jgi:hypothetical protein
MLGTPCGGLAGRQLAPIPIAPDEIAFASSKPAATDSRSNLAHSLIGPVYTVVDELNVFDADHVVVVADGIVDKVLRVLG